MPPPALHDLVRCTACRRVTSLTSRTLVCTRCGGTLFDALRRAA